MFDFKYIFYLFSRLTPFLIICFFLLQSLIRYDLTGPIYLAGLILACIFTILFGNFPGIQSMNKKTKLPGGRYDVCRLIEFNGGPISYLPLGTTIIGFTFFYLLYTAIQYNLIKENAFMIFLFCCIIVNDFYYNFVNGCSELWVVLFSLILGSSTGVLWAYIVQIIGDPKLQIITGTNRNTSCLREASVQYQCKKHSAAKTASTST